MQRDAGVAFVGKLNNVIAFFLVFPKPDDRNPLSVERMMGPNDSYTRNIVTMRSLRRLWRDIAGDLFGNIFNFSTLPLLHLVKLYLGFLHQELET